MPLIPFSKRYNKEFLNRKENNFNILLDKIGLFYRNTRADIKNGESSRRKLTHRFNYKEELNNTKFNQTGISTEEIASEFNDMLSGTIRHHDPTAAFNIIPSPLFDVIAGITLASLYNSNTCWDFISGKLCLYEKKIARILGNLVEWSNADGFVVTGGKQAIAYAIKNGIERAKANNPGEMNEYVVICSATAHYSIENVCNDLGIRPGNCVRVASHPSGEINLDDLKQRLALNISAGKKIAAVIAVAGGTINLTPDPIFLIKQTINDIANKNKLDYVPYLHVDSVITWTWLAFKDNLSSQTKANINPKILKKIQSVLNQVTDIKYADSFAADFHKTGFCPYAAGVFIAKESINLSNTSTEYFTSENPFFGELELFRQTFENSRSSLPIVAIWISIRRMGLEGLRQFVLYQLEVCECFKQKIREKYNAHFEILNDHSRGWEIVLKPHFQQIMSWDYLQKSTIETQQDYSRRCHAFITECWYSPFEDESLKYPVIGYIPKYSRKGIHEKSFPALLIHPTSLHYDEQTITELLDQILNIKTKCISSLKSTPDVTDDRYLAAIVPPR